IHAFTGQPIVGACVGMWQNDAILASTHTDANGYFSFNGLGYFQILVQALKFHDLEQSVQILPIQIATLNFNLVCLEPASPSRAYGRVIYRRFIHQVNRVHRIRWKPSRDPSITSYRIYREGKFLAEILATDPSVFEDEWRSEKEKTYQLTAVNVF